MKGGRPDIPDEANENPAVRSALSESWDSDPKKRPTAQQLREKLEIAAGGGGAGWIAAYATLKFMLCVCTKRLAPQLPELHRILDQKVLVWNMSGLSIDSKWL